MYNPDTDEVKLKWLLKQTKIKRHLARASHNRPNNEKRNYGMAICQLDNLIERIVVPLGAKGLPVLELFFSTWNS
jgi:hypothetical protein